MPSRVTHKECFVVCKLLLQSYLISIQALGMLYWHKYNFEKSIEDLANFTPLPGRWFCVEFVSPLT